MRVFAAALGIMSVPVLAQNPVPADEPATEIVVEGTRADKGRIRKFVDALTDTKVTSQIARFDTEVCPAAIGLPENQNQMIVRRLRRVAEAAAIPLAKPNCRPNSLLIVTQDKNDLIRALRWRFPAYFKDGLKNPTRIPREPGPAQAWHLEGLLDATGEPATVVKTDDGNRFYATSSMESSRLRPSGQPHFFAGILVVELEALRGLTVTQLADYAAMRLYARTDPRRANRSDAPSILRVLEAPMNSAVPITMTSWDLAYLKSLYASDPVRFATQQRNEMTKIIGDELRDRE